MKRCRCVSIDCFRKRENYNYIKIGDIIFYEVGDMLSVDEMIYVTIDLYDIDGNFIFSMLEFEFKRNFIDLIVHRKRIIRKMLRREKLKNFLGDKK